MTIKEYIRDKPEYDIDLDYDFDFVESDNEDEAKENIIWVLENRPELEILSTLIRSYYGCTITWEY